MYFTMLLSLKNKGLMVMDGEYPSPMTSEDTNTTQSPFSESISNHQIHSHGYVSDSPCAILWAWRNDNGMDGSVDLQELRLFRRGEGRQVAGI
jgi:hypothetical protein